MAPPRAPPMPSASPGRATATRPTGSGFRQHARHAGLLRQRCATAQAEHRRRYDSVHAHLRHRCRSGDGRQPGGLSGHRQQRRQQYGTLLGAVSATCQSTGTSGSDCSTLPAACGTPIREAISSMPITQDAPGQVASPTMSRARAPVLRRHLLRLVPRPWLRPERPTAAPARPAPITALPAARP